MLNINLLNFINLKVILKLFIIITLLKLELKVGLIDENFKIKLFKLGGNKINFVRMEIEKLEKFYSK